MYVHACVSCKSLFGCFLKLGSWLRAYEKLFSKGKLFAKASQKHQDVGKLDFASVRQQRYVVVLKKRPWRVTKRVFFHPGDAKGHTLGNICLLVGRRREETFLPSTTRWKVFAVPPPTSVPLVASNLFSPSFKRPWRPSQRLDAGKTNISLDFTRATIKRNGYPVSYPNATTTDD